MKILLVTHKFSPDVGGIETTSEMLAFELNGLGHTVTVLTHSKLGDEPDRFPFRVVRSPKRLEVLKCVKAADVVFHNNVCLQFAWPLVLIRRPWVIAVHTWISRTDRTLGLRDRVKLATLRFASVISISRAIADHLPVPSAIIPNAYRDDSFKIIDGATREENSLVFLGRLVPDKGAHLLLEALSILKERSLRPSLKIIGSGPERELLEEQVTAFDLKAQVTFAGTLTGPDLVQQMNTRDIIVIPSLWAEPFGLVALEGIACGCVAVGSSDGGLPDAVGSAGILFPNGDPNALSYALESLMTDATRKGELRAARTAHLKRHTAAAMGLEYAAVLEAAVASVDHHVDGHRPGKPLK